MILVALSVIENTDSPHIGVFGLFERCNFTENFATQAGGAVGVAFNLPSISQQQILPLEIRDWWVWYWRELFIHYSSPPPPITTPSLLQSLPPSPNHYPLPLPQSLPPSPSPSPNHYPLPPLPITTPSPLPQSLPPSPLPLSQSLPPPQSLLCVFLFCLIV